MCKIFKKNWFVKFLEGFYSTVLSRFIILAVLPFVLTVSFFLYIKKVSQYTEEVRVEGVAVTFVENSQNRLDEIKNNIARLDKIPEFVFRFNLYAINNIESRAGNKKLISLLNIDIGGKYTGGIKFKTMELLLPNQDISALSKAITSRSIVRSIKLQDYESTKSGILEIKNGSSYSIFILPTLSCFLFVYILIIAFIYAIIIAFNSWLKFILLGHPLLETIKEYQKRKL